MRLESEKLRRAMVEHLRYEGYIRSESVEKAMLEVPRELFVPAKYASYAYIDHPLEIGYGQTISAPHMVAMMLEILEIGEDDRILEIGGGLGYHAAVASRIARNGTVYSIEIIPELADEADIRLKSCGYDNVETYIADGGNGLPEKAPFDRIFVACAVPQIPAPIMEQLRDGGRLVAPVGSRDLQTLVLAMKEDGVIKTERHGYCRFVEMRGRWGFS